ncbi:MAG: hypothetical protein QW303_00600 [Nitrososphaerota archaeon]
MQEEFKFADIIEGSLKISDSLYVAKKITCKGLLDPTGLELEPQPSNPGNQNTLWITSSSGDLMKGSSPVLSTTSSITDKSIVTFDGTTGKTQSSNIKITNSLVEGCSGLSLVQEPANPGDSFTLWVDDPNGIPILGNTALARLSSATDKAVVRCDGTLGVLQDSLVTIDDSGNMTATSFRQSASNAISPFLAQKTNGQNIAHASNVTVTDYNSIIIDPGDFFNNSTGVATITKKAFYTFRFSWRITTIANPPATLRARIVCSGSVSQTFEESYPGVNWLGPVVVSGVLLLDSGDTVKAEVYQSQSVSTTANLEFCSFSIIPVSNYLT